MIGEKDPVFQFVVSWVIRWRQNLKLAQVIQILSLPLLLFQEEILQKTEDRRSSREEFAGVLPKDLQFQTVSHRMVKVQDSLPVH